MDRGIGGTLVWYYAICERQVWLLARNILPEQDDNNIRVGRLLDEMTYPRERQRGVNVDNTIVIDFLGDQGVVAEVKKSSRALKAARLQVAYYLYYLKHNKGFETEAVILVPEERRRHRVELTPELEAEVEQAIREIEMLRASSAPVKARRGMRCRRCAYAPICWA